MSLFAINVFSWNRNTRGAAIMKSNRAEACDLRYLDILVENPLNEAKKINLRRTLYLLNVLYSRRFWYVLFFCICMFSIRHRSPSIPESIPEIISAFNEKKLINSLQIWPTHIPLYRLSVTIL